MLPMGDCSYLHPVRPLTFQMPPQVQGGYQMDWNSKYLAIAMHGIMHTKKKKILNSAMPLYPDWTMMLLRGVAFQSSGQ